jgi:hypothetical protein
MSSSAGKTIRQLGGGRARRSVVVSSIGCAPPTHPAPPIRGVIFCYDTGSRGPMGAAWSGVCFLCSVRCVRACKHADALTAAAIPFIGRNPCCRVCTCGRGLGDVVEKIVMRVPHPPKAILDTVTGTLVPFKEYVVHAAAEPTPVRSGEPMGLGGCAHTPMCTQALCAHQPPQPESARPRCRWSTVVGIGQRTEEATIGSTLSWARAAVATACTCGHGACCPSRNSKPQPPPSG